MKARINVFRSQNDKSLSRPTLVLVPGGPGFSAATLGKVDSLLRSFDVVTVDPPGTGGLPRSESYTYDAVLSAIENELKALKRPMVIAGHSFGAVFAADLATRKDYEVVGYVGIAAPISVDAMKAAATAPGLNYTSVMQKTEDAFMANPSDANWKEMIESVSPIYFGGQHLKEGLHLLVNDKAEYKLYLQVLFPYVSGAAGQDVSRRLSEFRKTKLLVAGENDKLVPLGAIKNDAASLGCQFEMIPGASHFVFNEQPQKTTELFEKYFSK